MGIDATTFILQIANFLVLLWLLRRFLFGPVQAMITRRQQETDAARAAVAAEQARLQADRTALEQEQASRLADRQAAMQQLVDEIAAERQRRLAGLEKEMADEQARAEAKLAARQAQQANRLDAEAAERADAFLRRYLARLAGPALEQAIVGLFLQDLAALDEADRAKLRVAPPDGIELVTAFEAGDTLRQQVVGALAALIGQAVPMRWRVDTTLGAGISVRLDGHLLEASLARALEAFRAEGRS